MIRPPARNAIVFVALLSQFAFACNNAHEDPLDDATEKAGWLTLQPGDLLFQTSRGGELSEAIEAVTEGRDGRDFSHVGMIVRIGDTLAVIEAIGDGVQLTGLAAFHQRSSMVMEGRIKPEHRALAERAAEEALKHLGTPYDKAYLPDNDKLYCSELVALAFASANGGVAVFEQTPMTFKDPVTGEFLGTWVTYYQELGIPIPEGIPGCNPGGLSRSSILMH